MTLEHRMPRLIGERAWNGLLLAGDIVRSHFYYGNLLGALLLGCQVRVARELPRIQLTLQKQE